MLLDEREIALLARFFAKRFPHAADRGPLLERAGLSDSTVEGSVAAWEDIVARAQQAQGLPRLGKALRTDDPDDVNLREVRHLLAGDPKPRWSVPAAALGAVCALGIVLVGGAAWALGTRDVEGRLAEPHPGTALAETVNAASSAQVAVVAPSVEVDPVVVTTAPETPVEVVAVAEPPAPVVAKSVPSIMPGSDRYLAPDHCARQGGDVGGWWYVGSEPPGKAGEVIVVPHDAYVRAEVPGTSNGWNTKTTVKCVLYAGDKVRLNGPPVRVPVGAWWVSTTAADVVVAGGQRIKDRG